MSIKWTVGEYWAGFFVLDPRLLLILTISTFLGAAGTVLLMKNKRLWPDCVVRAVFIWWLFLALAVVICNYIVGYPVFVIRSSFTIP